MDSKYADDHTPAVAQSPDLAPTTQGSLDDYRTFMHGPFIVVERGRFVHEVIPTGDPYKDDYPTGPNTSALADARAYYARKDHPFKEGFLAGLLERNERISNWYLKWADKMLRKLGVEPYPTDFDSDR